MHIFRCLARGDNVIHVSEYVSASMVEVAKASPHSCARAMSKRGLRLEGKLNSADRVHQKSADGLECEL